MADFCKQCSIELFGEDCKELAGLGEPLTEEELKQGYGFPALCEGCGCCLVDNEGVCLGGECCSHTNVHKEKA